MSPSVIISGISEKAASSLCNALVERGIPCRSVKEHGNYDMFTIMTDESLSFTALSIQQVWCAGYVQGYEDA